MRVFDHMTGWLIGSLLAGASAAALDFDHSHRKLGAVLEARVVEGRVDYAALAADRARLDAYLAELAAPGADEFAAWSSEQRLAYWLNAYNAFVLATVVEHYPIVGRTLVGLAFPRGSIWQIKGVWKGITHRVAGGREVSLDEIENQIIRKEFDDPRIHFALVCASLGCPDLTPEPYRADRLDEQLEERTRAFLSDVDKGVRLDGNQVFVSKIFKWFDGDFESFAGSDPCFEALKPRHAGPLSFIARYRPDLATLNCDRVEVDYLDYDWHLNELSAAHD